MLWPFPCVSCCSPAHSADRAPYEPRVLVLFYDWTSLLYNMADGGSVRNKGLVADDLGHVVPLPTLRNI